MTAATTHQEVELKRLLRGENAADRLVLALGRVTADKRQVNHVLDTDGGRLQKQRYSVRLRFEDGAPILTAKGPATRLGGDTSARAEAEASVDPAVAAAILGGHSDAVEMLRERVTDPEFGPLWQALAAARAGLPLQVVGAFENRRRVVPVRLPSGLELAVEVDQTRFPDGHVDEEVEIELASGELVSEVEAWLAREAEQAGVVTAALTAKLARFYAHRA